MALVLRNSLSSMLDDFFGDDFLSPKSEIKTGINMPAINIKEDNENYMIEVAAPGLEKKDFDIQVDNDVLNISSSTEEKKEEKDGKWIRREFGYSQFKRSFSLPESVDTEKIKANHSNGILVINIPKKEEAKVKPPKQISIS